MRIGSSRKSVASLMTWRACYLTLAALGIYMFYLAIDGVWSGEVTLFSKRTSGTIAWAESPLMFIGTVLAWLLGAFFMVRLAVGGWREL